MPEGNFLGDKNAEGEGKNKFGFMLYVGGKYYEGYWENDMKNGQGLLAS